MLTHLIQCRELFGPPERQEELKKCWDANDKVFDEFTFPEGRPTFQELFRMCKPDRVNVIANSDIYFERLAHIPPQGHVWALSRYDIDPTGAAVLWDHRDSQDAYIVQGGPHEIDADTVVNNFGVVRPFVQGLAGCDNRLMFVLRKAGFTVSNPSKTIRSYHLHLSQYRSYLDTNGPGRGGDKIERIPPPYEFCTPHTL